MTGNVTGNVSGSSGSTTGNAATATTSTNVTVADESSDTTCFPLFTTAATGDLAPKSGSNLTFNSSSGTLGATVFSGSGSSLTGVVIETASTGSAEIPVGTTAQRDGSPATGMFRFNSTTTGFEGYNGSAWGAIGGADGGALKLLHVRDEKSATTNGGDASAGTDNIRVLNTVVTNEITGASLASNQITLPAGTYYCDATAPVFSVNMHRAFLYNVTDSSVTLLGIPQYATSFSALGGNNSVVMGRFTISGEKVFEIRHRTESAKATNGLGNDMNDGRLSIYTTVVIRKVS